MQAVVERHHTGYRHLKLPAPHVAMRYALVDFEENLFVDEEDEFGAADIRGPVRRQKSAPALLGRQARPSVVAVATASVVGRPVADLGSASAAAAPTDAASSSAAAAAAVHDADRTKFPVAAVAVSDADWGPLGQALRRTDGLDPSDAAQAAAWRGGGAGCVAVAVSAAAADAEGEAAAAVVARPAAAGPGGVR